MADCRHWTPRPRRGLTQLTVALFALLMLSYASVQSTLMQISGPAQPMAGMLCGQMPASGVSPAMSMANTMDMGRQGHPPAHDVGHKAPCPYCETAAHIPLVTFSPPVRPPSACVFVAFQTLADHGPRGPPTLEPRARGPPQPFTTA